MKHMTAVVLLTILSSVGCARQEMKAPDTKAPNTQVPAPNDTAANATAPAAEKTYPMTATIISRDPGRNTLYLDNKEVPGEMPAMKMDYELRGAKVATAPKDGSPVVVTVHDRDGSVWITDVKK
jgi:hypothetical protein